MYELFIILSPIVFVVAALFGASWLANKRYPLKTIPADQKIKIFDLREKGVADFTSEDRELRTKMAKMLFAHSRRSKGAIRRENGQFVVIMSEEQSKDQVKA